MPEVTNRRRRGCETCRKRKKKCDMQKPHCRQCINAHLPCGGYASNLVWIHSSQSQPKSQPQPAPPHPLLQPLTTTTSTISKLTPRSPSYSIEATSTALVTSAREQLYFGHFWSTLISSSSSSSSEFPSEAAKLSPLGWAHLIPQLYRGERPLRLVSMALAMAGLAVENDDSQLRLKALQSYNMAIRMVSSALVQPACLDRDGLLLAIRLMALFEVAFAPRNDPRVLVWHEHGEGQQAIFLARGPQAFTTGTAHQLFSDSRVNMAFLALGRRTTSPFSSDEWMTIPWSNRHKTPMDQLIDIMLQIPQTLERLSSLAPTALEAKQDRTRDRILLECQALETSLALWAQGIGTEMFHYDHDVADSPLPPPKTDREFAFVHLCGVYWFTQMVVCSVTAFVNIGHDEQAVKEADTKRKTFASKSAHALPLLFRKEGGLAQDTTGVLCLGIALRYFMAVEPEGQKSSGAEVLEKVLDRELGSVAVSVRQSVVSMFGGMDPCGRKGAHAMKPSDRISWF